MNTRTILAAVALAVTLFRVPQALAETDCKANADVYGVIEIGGKGVKATIAKIVSAPKDSQGSCDLDVLNEFNAYNVDPIIPSHLDDTVSHILEQRENIQEWARGHGLRLSNIFYVLSSGVANLEQTNPTYWSKLTDAIEDATGEEAGVISSADEAALTFDGVVNTAICQRRSQVTLIDIGSSNTKGAYLTFDPNKPNCTSANLRLGHVTFEIPWGVKTLEARVNSIIQDNKGLYVTTLQSTLESGEVAGALDRIVRLDDRGGDGKIGFSQRQRVYLAGGIPYSLATLAHPEARDPYVRLTSDDIDAFYLDLQQHPECFSTARYFDKSVPESTCKLHSTLEIITDPTTKAAVEAEFTDILQNIFPTNTQLLAGAGLLKTISDHWNFKNRQVFFARQARHSWMLGYLLLKFGHRSDLPRQYLPSTPVHGH